MPDTCRTVGKNIARIGAIERLRGRPVFSADLSLDDALVLKALRSGRPHAVVKDIDVGPALAVDGVVRVFTEADITGENRMGIINRDQPLLADGRVRSPADPVALVAARTEEAAERAVAAIRVAYEDLPAVFTPDEALAPGAPAIHPKGNLLFARRIRRGDVKEAFSRCAVVVEHTYRTPFIEHAYLEPDAGAGFVDDDGTLVIYASTQNPHYDLAEVTRLLGVEDGRVRIIQAATGGGFGSKLDLNVQGFIGLALYHLGQPVRMVYSREETFLATAKRHPLEMHFTTGADEKGRLLATRVLITCNTGAYGSYGIAVASRSAVHATGPYEIENVEIESRCVYTNQPFCGAMRGFGTPQAAVAHEGQMDLLAQRLGMDPLEIRRINAFRTGSVTATGQKLSASVGIGECLQALAPHYDRARSQWMQESSRPYVRRGVGIGCMWYGIGNTGTKNPATARVAMDREGRVTLFTGCADIGQGSSTVLTQICAEVLGLAPGDIRLVVADTGRTPNAGATSASRQTYISGNAVKTAAGKLAAALIDAAADRLHVPAASLALSGGEAIADGGKTGRLPFTRLAEMLHEQGASLEFEGFFDPPTTALDPETGEGIPYATYAFAGQLALVEADTLTGEVRVMRIVAAHDVGRAIHPENVKGQICGGVAMGLGFALMEEFVPGSTLSFKDYHIPTCADMPEIVPIIVESEEPSGPFGAKGVGEPALIPTAPAILNALADALGKRIDTLPASLESVLETSIATGHFGPREV